MRYLSPFIILTGCALILSGCVTTNESKQALSTTNYETSTSNIQLGVAYLDKGESSLAKQKFMAALQASPDLPASWYAMAYYHEVTGKEDLADQEFRKAIALAPDSGETHNNYGTFLCRNGKYKQAIEQFKLAVSKPRYTQDGSAYENAGICALQIPDKIAAMHYFQKALVNDPNLPNALLHLGELSYQNKDYVTARNCLKRYKTLHEPNRDSKALAIQLAKVTRRHGQVTTGNKMVNSRFNEMAPPIHS
ncbi:MAG: type IV pilus biogenesis/stability protein PilW [Coxiellaceae bacterium]|nr:type IV pilus biogenesis/stability protein PilW [Coxiellaceae bacterium]